ncbi:MAG: PQQ-binding-like beta-propeller repeat protein [Polyangiaceae bacterium]
MELTELKGELIPLTGYPSRLAFNADGTLLAAAGSSELYVVDLRNRAVRFKGASGLAKALAFSGDGKTLFVGAKNITLIDVATNKKSKVVMKGHKAVAQALESSADGTVLFTGGGSFIDTSDRFVRAFDVATGAERWKVKPGKNSGALSLTLAGQRLFVAAEDGVVRAFDAKDGTPTGETTLAEAQKLGSPFGGVVATGEHLAAAWETKHTCTVAWLSQTTLKVDRSEVLPLADVDPSESMSVGVPLAAGTVVAVPVYYCVSGYSRIVVALFDSSTRALRRLVQLVDASDPRCALSPDGASLAWGVADGVTLAHL